MARFAKEADDYVMLVDLQEKYKNTPKVVEDIVSSAPSRRLGVQGINARSCTGWRPQGRTCMYIPPAKASAVQLA